jgi:hypothetical protein
LTKDFWTCRHPSIAQRPHIKYAHAELYSDIC